jgi:5'-AMP-activated protein kinase, catalytic alpha subunit
MGEEERPRGEGEIDVEGDVKVVKMEIQLYRRKEGEYVIDLQAVKGESFFFMDLAALFLTEIRVK